MNPKGNRKILELDELKTLRDRHPTKKIVHCHGVFDVLHAGHLSYFESAKRFGDLLVVTITADEFVNKGPGRPYFNSAVRANMIAALEAVDFVGISRFPTAVPLIETLRPHFYVKGPDYKDRAADVTGAIFDEEAAAEKSGGRLVFTEDATFSSSTLINKFFTPWTEEQTKCIAAVQDAGGMDKILEVLDRVKYQKVHVVGEPIVDTYIFCTPESISSKSPSVSARFAYEENYAGGSLAIANHLSDFVGDVHLYMTHGGEAYFNELLKTRLDPRIRIFAQEIPSIPTPRKTRFIAIDRSQRIFELTNLRSDQWLHHSPKEFCELVRKNNSPENSTILADFGHGLFEGPVVETMAALEGFIGLNVQTNSSNFGFNPFTKHKKFSFLSIDIREARIACHDRSTSTLELARMISRDLSLSGAGMAMTLGATGAYYFPRQNSELSAPAFADSVLDATGAGDAFFALTSLLVKAGCPDVMVPFLGNVFAGLKTKIIGNKSAVSKAQFVKAIAAILK